MVCPGRGPPRGAAACAHAACGDGEVCPVCQPAARAHLSLSSASGRTVLPGPLHGVRHSRPHFSSPRGVVRQVGQPGALSLHSRPRGQLSRSASSARHCGRTRGGGGLRLCELSPRREAGPTQADASTFGCHGRVRGRALLPRPALHRAVQWGAVPRPGGQGELLRQERAGPCCRGSGASSLRPASSAGAGEVLEGDREPAGLAVPLPLEREGRRGQGARRREQAAVLSGAGLERGRSGG